MKEGVGASRIRRDGTVRIRFPHFCCIFMLRRCLVFMCISSGAEGGGMFTLWTRVTWLALFVLLGEYVGRWRLVRIRVQDDAVPAFASRQRCALPPRLVYACRRAFLQNIDNRVPLFGFPAFHLAAGEMRVGDERKITVSRSVVRTGGGGMRVSDA